MSTKFLTALLFTALNLSAQEQRQDADGLRTWEKGLPLISTHTPQDYKAHVQNWSFTQDNSGIIYTGNTSGILEYDGVSWRLMSLPNGSPAKSFAKSDDGTIYVGAVRDFGYLHPDPAGQMQFQTLLPQLDTAYHNFADIWFTYAIGDAVYFISDNLIFKWHENRFKIWKAEGGFGFASQVDDQIYVDKKGVGLMRFESDSLIRIPDGDKFVNSRGSITTILPYPGGKILMGHFRDGLFLYDHHEITPFKKEGPNLLLNKNIYDGVVLPNGDFVFTTSGQGCFIVDRDGNIIRWLGKTSGLASDVIIGCYVDREGGLWLATENGINRLEVSSPLRVFGAHSGLAEGADKIAYFNKKLYAATRNGVSYLKDVSRDPEKPEYDFQRVNGIDLQTWDIVTRNGYLLAGNFSGLYQIDPADRAEQLIADNTSDLCLSWVDSNRVYAGTMTGKLFVLQFLRNRWQVKNSFASIEGRIMRIEEARDGSIWISTRYNGVYRLDWSKSNADKTFDKPYRLTHFTTAEGLPEISYNIVYQANGNIYFSTRKGIYQFDHTTQKFHRDRTLMSYMEMLPPGGEHIVKGSADGGIWITGGSEFDTRIYKLGEENSNEVNAFRRFSSLHIIDVYEHDNILFLSGSQGVVGYNPVAGTDYDSSLPVSIRKIITTSDSLIAGGNASQAQFEETLSLPFRNNYLRFTFALPSYDRPEGNQYQYYLEGFDEHWSSWSAEIQRDFTNLPEGNYRFRVKGRNIYGQISEEAIYAFTILPPWFRTWWAYLLYALTVAGVMALIVRWRSEQLRSEKEELENIVAERTRQLSEQARQLADHADQLKEMDKMKSHLFANISHEFRTPLTLIKGPVAALLKTQTEFLPLADAQMINRNADRLTRLVNQLLDLSKLDAGKLDLEMTAGDLNQFLRLLAAAFGSHAEQRKMTFRISIPQTVSYASFDHDKLEKIVYNLLSNAFKFTPDQGCITMKATHKPHQLELTITDSGRGIPQESLPRIFDRFYQTDNSATREQEGTGIGLALTKELVHLMGGTLSVRSSPENGSSFTIVLPVVPIDPDKQIPGHPPGATDEIDTDDTAGEEMFQSDAPSVIETSLVLIVEDNVDMRRFIAAQLKSDYQVVEAEHGRAGLALATEKVPDLIITDLMMPQMDGISLCKHLKTDERTSHIPVIMLTARAGQAHKLEGLETGADDYLTKPFDQQELQVRVKNLIAQRQQLRNHFSNRMTLEPRQIAITSVDEQFLQKMIDLTEAFMSEAEFGAPQLQEHLAMSKTQLYRKVKALTDQSPGEFIRNHRLQRAAQILSRKGDNVTQVAYAVGFNNLSYFARCFKEVYGVAPSAYTGKPGS